VPQLNEIYKNADDSGVKLKEIILEGGGID
jgi:hypothetical protein